jgi:hypothetical protein
VNELATDLARSIDGVLVRLAETFDREAAALDSISDRDDPALDAAAELLDVKGLGEHPDPVGFVRHAAVGLQAAATQIRDYMARAQEQR